MKSEHKKSSYRTFEEMGVVFSEGSGCHTCRDNSCHNTVPLKKTGEEHNVHISTNPLRTLFRIHSTANTSSTSSDDICEDFDNESDAVKFVCETFEWFKCF